MRLAVYGHDGRGGLAKTPGRTRKSGTHGYPATSEPLACVLCGEAVRRPKAGKPSRFCLRHRELFRSLRRARALALDVFDPDVARIIERALAELREAAERARP